MNHFLRPYLPFGGQKATDEIYPDFHKVEFCQELGINETGEQNRWRLWDVAHNFFGLLFSAIISVSVKKIGVIRRVHMEGLIWPPPRH